MPRFLPNPFRALLTNIGISIAVVVLVLLLTQSILFEFTPLRRAELSLIDHRFQQRGIRASALDSSNIIIVAISQDSYHALPDKWPWPKSYYVKLIKNLERAGAKAIGLDIVFSSSDANNPAEEQELRSLIKGSSKVVLAGKLEPDPRYYLIRRGTEDYGNIFTDSASHIGMVNVPTDVDGILRRYMPFAYDSSRSKRLPTFSTALLNVYFNQPPMHTATVDGDNFNFLGRFIPKYDSTSFLINYYGPSGVFRRVNIADVLDDKDFLTVDEMEHPGEEVNTFDDPDNGYLTDGTFNGKIVLVGSIMPEDKDLFSVSLGEGKRDGDNQMYGVEIHANVIQNILARDFIVKEPFWLTAIVAFGLSLFTFALTAGIKAIRTRYSAHLEILGLAVIFAELFIIYWVSIRLFTEANYLTDMMSPILTVIGCYVTSTIYNYVTERKQRMLIKSMFTQYVNPSVVDELLANPEKLRLGGERKELTVFFSDIEHFTGISEKIPPEDLVAILNEYLSVMTTIIFTHGGTLDKYQGDAIVAFWGAPIPQKDHTLRACKAAVEMQKVLQVMRENWQRDGKPQLNVRIGINTGEMIVGNMGGMGRFDYTVIGDSVNLGARLEGANKQYKTNILVSEHTYRKIAGSVFARELDLLVVAGKTEPIRVYELIGIIGEDTIPSHVAKLTEHYTQGLLYYRGREWSKAIEEFQQCLTLVPADYPSQLYIERCRQYLVSPPTADWNGAFILESK
jgi:adenylate cyclase